MAVLNINTILLSLNFFAIITPFVKLSLQQLAKLIKERIYSFSLFLPTIISSLGYTRITAQLFTVPPNMLGFFAVLIGSYTSDKIKARGPIMLVGCTVAIAGYIMLLASKRPAVAYGGSVNYIHMLRSVIDRRIGHS